VGIDATTERLIVEILHAEAQRGCLVLVIHHDLATLGQYFDEVVLLNRGWAVHGTPAQVLTPENLARAYGIPMLAQAQGFSVAGV
jgi:ABC-type Mn2+/Zn2+ transport system ATPase subunit